MNETKVLDLLTENNNKKTHSKDNHTWNNTQALRRNALVTVEMEYEMKMA